MVESSEQLAPPYRTGRRLRDGDGRIGLELRVAVTGHRWPVDTDPVALASAGFALAEMHRRCRNESTASTSVGLTVVSSLAEGSDRIVARAGLALGARLEVVLPLPVEDYSADFETSASKESFDDLLAAAASVTLVADQGARHDAYAAAGRTVLARADALLAVWDGGPAHGPGGTAEIVDQARKDGVPLYWLRVTPPIDDHPLAVETVEMPDAVRLLDDDGFSKLDLFNRLPNPPARYLASLNDFPGTVVFARQAFAAFARGECQALRMQRRLRIVYQTMYTLSVLAVAVGAAQVIFAPTRPGIGWVEFAALAVILVALTAGRRGHFLDRWSSMRYMAERIRSLAYLAPLLGPTTQYIGELDTPVANPMEAWIRRALDELMLHGPMPTMAQEVDLEQAKATLLHEWIDPQLDYQRTVNKTSRRRHRGFTVGAIGLFGVSLIAAFLHSSGLLGESDPNYLGFISLVVPATAAAVSGYAAQRDYTRQEIRSGVMLDKLRTAATHLRQARDLTELRRAALNVEATLQGEAADWYTAVRLHVPRVP